MIEQKTPFAPGVRIVVCDVEWLVRRVDTDIYSCDAMIRTCQMCLTLL